MRIIEYDNQYHPDVIDLILGIQNDEAGINLSLEEQPDLNDIENCYLNSGGNFWIAVDDNDRVIGTIAVMRIDDEWCVLKKFFVRAEYRSQKIGWSLYQTLLEYVRTHNFKHIILDTPSVATKSHRFYKSAGFSLIQKENLPIPYTYPDRNSLLFHLLL